MNTVVLFFKISWKWFLLCYKIVIYLFDFCIMFVLSPLPFEKSSLLPIISEETLDYHYGKHHKAYVDKLNILIEWTEFEWKPLEEIILSSDGALFNNAAQTRNHTFYRKCLQSPRENNVPEGVLKEKLFQTFGSFEAFVDKFSESAINNFGSGRTWLVKDKENNLKILNTSNAGNPLTQGYIPLLTVDVWEHAYYIQHRNARADYIKDIFSLINWNFVEEQMVKN